MRDSIFPTKGQLRIREWNDWWLAERWDGKCWSHVYGAPSKENLEYWLEFMQPHENIDSSATD